MKTNLERLSFVNVNLFYVVSFRESGIELQGTLSSELVKYCTKELGVTLQTNDSGWLQGNIQTLELGNLSITLT